MVTCELCKERFADVLEVNDHLRLMHPEQWEEPLFWPDGEPVIVDCTQAATYVGDLPDITLPDGSKLHLTAHAPVQQSDGSVDVSESLLGGLAADAEDDADPSPARPVAPGPTDGVDQAGAGPFDSLLSLVQSDEGLADLGGAQRPGTGISDHSVNDALTPPRCQEDIDAQHDGPVVPASGLETTTGTTGPQDHTNGTRGA